MSLPYLEPPTEGCRVGLVTEIQRPRTNASLRSISQEIKTPSAATAVASTNSMGQTVKPLMCNDVRERALHVQYVFNVFESGLNTRCI